MTKFIKLFLYLFLAIKFVNASELNFADLDKIFDSAIENRVFPSAVALINYKNKTIYHKAFGNYTYDANSQAVTKDTLYDIASLTKVVVTTTLAMMLYDASLLNLDDHVCNYFPLKKDICIKHLLTHTSGLRDEKVNFCAITAQELWHKMLVYPAQDLPGNSCLYQCTNMIIMQKIIEKITGESIEKLFYRKVTEVLNMQNTFFNPQNKKKCAPTTHQKQGEVHDPRANIFGGVSGNAGLFSTSSDLEKFMKMIMNDGQTLIKSETINSWCSRQCAFNRGFGWEIGRHLSSNSFGHFGWTGTSIWADKNLQLFCILLTNRTYPNDDNFNIRQFRIDFHDLIMEIIFG